MHMKNFLQHRHSPLKICGAVSMILGFILLFSVCTLPSSARNKSDSPVLEISAENEAEELEQDIEFTQKVKDNGLKTVPLLFIGGFLILFSIPMFYLSYDNKTIFLRKRRKRREENENDEELPDYPDDDYDYVLTREKRQELMEERDRQIDEILRKQCADE